jgi:hypothetical protein
VPSHSGRTKRFSLGQIVAFFIPQNVRRSQQTRSFIPYARFGNIEA